MKYFFGVFFTLTFLFLSAFGVSCIYGYIFPLKYTSEISSASKSFGVSPALVASVIKSESSYNPNALSPKGAVGLMQLLPSTADYLAKKLDIKSYDIKNPKDNIYLGTYYLSSLLAEFQDETLALCAFNAGPGNVNRWLSLYSKDGKTLTEIPFAETRNYVKKCQRAKRYYKTKNVYFRQ